MAYWESELLPISALQHLLYCDRQCALIHVERLWAENRLTAEGSLLHKKAHGGRREKRPSGLTTRSLPVRSLALGLFGITDVIRWCPGLDGAVVPVEYKRGRPKANDCDRVQLAAQALCLEEMLGRSVESGEIFYGKLRRRTPVEFTSELRRTTIDAAARLHELIRSGRTPPAEPGRKCDRCSLRELCLPKLASKLRIAPDFQRAVDALLAPPEERPQHPHEDPPEHPLRDDPGDLPREEGGDRPGP
ncbi:CRISPR-associated protein Cas4 [Tundrisphaera sp. TA3]|uniref:CRISPR-associated protein Cas4 n=1 Tax=Tundrisphaera sp. TA3 TaxID=3435775 RepID=UPI003EBC18F1